MMHALDRQKLAAALDAVSSGGRTVCNITVTNPGLADDCMPLNVFGPSAASADAIAYVTDDIAYDATTTMHDIAGQVGGSPFATWAGPANASLSAEWRKLGFRSHSGARPSDLANCTGLALNSAAGTPRTEFVFGESPQGVSQRVWELAGEIDRRS